MSLINPSVKNKETVVFVSGNFNILHPGHLRLLRFARESGNRLIVGVESDRIAGNAAHIPEHLRLEGLQDNSLVDEVILVDEPIDQLILRIRPDVVVKGKEHELAFNPELAALEQFGGKLIFSSGETIFSSIDLIRREFHGADTLKISIPSDYLDRHGIELNRLRSLVHSYGKLRICVIGDLIVDEYITCEPLGMSQEDPTLVVTPIDSTRFIGGAGIVAAHAAGLGAKTNFISIAGIDASMEFAIEKLNAARVASKLFFEDSRPTTLKQRFRSGGKSLFRVSHLHQSGVSLSLQKQILSHFESIAASIDLLVFSDFNYGCLPQILVNQLVEIASNHKIILAADSQSSSQIGDIGRFKGMGLITPTEREARISTRNREDGLVILAEQLRREALAQNVILKLGGEGLLIHAGGGAGNGWITDKVAALNPSPKDVAGAGDSLLIASAMAIACGGNIWEASCLGSLAAAIQVGRVGNTPLTSDELLRQLK